MALWNFCYTVPDGEGNFKKILLLHFFPIWANVMRTISTVMVHIFTPKVLLMWVPELMTEGQRKVKTFRVLEWWLQDLHEWMNGATIKTEWSSFYKNQEAHGPWHSAWEPTWQFAKVPHYCLSTPWVEIELIFTLGAAVSEIRADFQNCHLWAWNLVIGQSSRSCTYTLFLPPWHQNWA